MRCGFWGISLINVTVNQLRNRLTNILRPIKKVVSLFLILFIAGISPLEAGPTELSPQGHVSLLTASPGDQLYTLFGHSALRIYDPVSGIDRTYNYGTFDFETQGFYWKFALGNLRYFLSTAPFETAKQAYLADGRTVTEQYLNLTPEQTKRLYHYLQANAKPENRYYSYEFFYDNCTTRIYDTIKAVVGDSLRFQKPFNPAKKSFRQFINPYLEPVSWLKVGINLLLGIPADQVPTGNETLFLPKILKKRFANAKIQNADSPVALVDNQTIYVPSGEAALSSPLLTPQFVFWSLLALVVPVGIAFPHKRSFWCWFDRILFSIVVGMGLFILFLWMFSAYPATKWNANIVWTLIAPIVLYIVTNKNKTYSEAWRLIELIILGVTLIVMTFFLIHQDIPPALYPVLVLVLFRGWVNFLEQKYAIVLEIN